MDVLPCSSTRPSSDFFFYFNSFSLSPSICSLVPLLLLLSYFTCLVFGFAKRERGKAVRLTRWSLFDSSGDVSIAYRFSLSFCLVNIALFFSVATSGLRPRVGTANSEQL